MVLKLSLLKKETSGGIVTGKSGMPVSGTPKNLAGDSFGWNFVVFVVRRLELKVKKVRLTVYNRVNYENGIGKIGRAHV